MTYYVGAAASNFGPRALFCLRTSRAGYRIELLGDRRGRHADSSNPDYGSAMLHINSREEEKRQVRV